jgi:hypothetical protein
MSSAYLSLCAIYRNEAPYLAEWIEFHRLVGVERFFLYDNDSDDDHLEVLRPHLDEGVVVRHDRGVFFRQQGAYEHALGEHRDASRWMAFIDTDEFLFSPTGRSLPDVLAGFERYPGVGVHRETYGTSSHKEKPEGLVTESYVWKFRGKASIKTIVDPARVERYQNPHAFVYVGGEPAVDENGEPIDGWFLDEPTSALLRVNHYHTKSEAEFERKLQRERADTGVVPGPRDDIPQLTGKIKDEAIAIYVPRLREALAQRYG